MTRTIGKKEAAVRATLATRPCAVLYALKHQGAKSCFAGFFNGALRRGRIYGDGGLFIGKAECEWDWQETWAELRDLGLINYTLITKPAPGAVSGKMTEVTLEITEKGRRVREDDMAYFRALMDAMHEDEA